MSLSLAKEIEKVEQLILKHDSDKTCLKKALTDCKSEIDLISLALEQNPWLKAKLDSEPPPPPTLPPPSISFGNIHQEKKRILGINFEAGNFEEIETLENFIEVEEILEEIIRKMFPNSNAHKKRKITEQDLPPQDQIKSTKRKKTTTPTVQHLAPPKSETDPPLPVIAKNPIPETSFLSKFKQAKSKFEEKLEKKKNKIKITTPQSKKKPKIEICKTPKTPQAPKVNKIDNYIFGNKVNLMKSSNRKSDEISMNTHEGNSLQSIAGKPREILQRIVTSQSAPHPRRQPPPPHTTSIQTEN